jgi:hypothetical protein
MLATAISISSASSITCFAYYNASCVWHGMVDYFRLVYYYSFGLGHALNHFYLLVALLLCYFFFLVVVVGKLDN